MTQVLPNTPKTAQTTLIGRSIVPNLVASPDKYYFQDGEMLRGNNSGAQCYISLCHTICMPEMKMINPYKYKEGNP